MLRERPQQGHLCAKVKHVRKGHDSKPRSIFLHGRIAARQNQMLGQPLEHTQVLLYQCETQVIQHIFGSEKRIPLSKILSAAGFLD